MWQRGAQDFITAKQHKVHRPEELFQFYIRGNGQKEREAVKKAQDKGQRCRMWVYKPLDGGCTCVFMLFTTSTLVSWFLRLPTSCFCPCLLIGLFGFHVRIGHGLPSRNVCNCGTSLIEFNKISWL